MAKLNGASRAQLFVAVLLALTASSAYAMGSKKGVWSRKPATTQNINSAPLPPAPAPKPTVAATSTPAPLNAYYVSKAGNDNNPGTLAAPFQSIQRAADVVGPGDTVIVDDGVYSGGAAGGVLVSFKKSGTADRPIVFRSKNKWGAVLDGGSSLGYALDIDNGSSYLEIQDFEIKNFRNSGVFSNSQTQLSNYITIRGNKIHDLGRYETTSDYGITGIYVRMKNHHWLIDKNIIYNIGRTGPDSYWMIKDHAIYIGTADTLANAAHHFTITNNIMWGCSGVAINQGSSNDLIANNVMAWSVENNQGSSTFIYSEGEVQNSTVVNNIFYQPPVANNAAIQTERPVKGWVVKNNIVYGGRMWTGSDASYTASMAGNNYCKSGCEKAEIDPKFVSAVKSSAPNVDFSLQSSSPAINAGVDVGLTSDYFGKPLVGLPDIGAIEY